MKKITLLCSFLCLIFLVNNLSFAKQNTSRLKNKIVISDLSKNCEWVLGVNIVDYKLCQSWTLDKNAVMDIWRYKEKADIFSPIRDLSPSDMRICYTGETTIDKVPYGITVCATSWLAVYAPNNEEVTYYACRHSGCAPYFLGNYVSEETLSKVDDKDVYAFEEKLMNKFNDNRSQVEKFLRKQQVSDTWTKTYKLSGEDTLNIDKGKCAITNARSNNRFVCYVFEYEDILYVYNELSTADGYQILFYKNKGIRYNNADFILKVDRKDQVILNSRMENPEH